MPQFLYFCIKLNMQITAELLKKFYSCLSTFFFCFRIPYGGLNLSYMSLAEQKH